MALVAVQGLWWPAPPVNQATPAFLSSVIDATGEKVAWIGRVWNKDRASKDITKVGFLPGAVTSAGGSGLTLSLQNVNAAAGPPYQPDGTPDQTVAFLASALTANTWYQTAALSANRTVAFGELLAVVIEYDASGRLGADAVNLNNINLASGTATYLASGVALFTASWAVPQAIPNILLEFSDGVFGTLDFGWPTSAVGTVNYNNTTDPDERGLEFTVPVECKCDGAYLFYQVASSGADADLVLYEGTTPLAIVSIDGSTVTSITSGKYAVVSFPEVTLGTSSTYRLALKPTSGTNVGIYYFDVSAANHFQAHAGGTSWQYNTRTDAGAWGTATATRRPWAGIRISALHAGGSAGGMLVHPGMNGRLV